MHELLTTTGGRNDSETGPCRGALEEVVVDCVEDDGSDEEVDEAVGRVCSETTEFLSADVANEEESESEDDSGAGKIEGKSKAGEFW